MYEFLVYACLFAGTDGRMKITMLQSRATRSSAPFMSSSIRKPFSEASVLDASCSHFEMLCLQNCMLVSIWWVTYAVGFTSTCLPFLVALN